MDACVEKSTAELVASKAGQDSFPSVDVIQERPVSKSLLVEGQEILSSAQPRVADGSVEESSIFSSAVEDNLQSALGEGSTSNVSSGRQPPFLLELFCGTAGVCAQFRTLGGRALGIDHHLKRTKLRSNLT